MCEQMWMWATLSPVGSSMSLDWLKPSEQKYPHAYVFCAARGNVIMPQLIRLTLTIPQGKIVAHLQCTDNCVALDVCFFFVCVWKAISDICFLGGFFVCWGGDLCFFYIFVANMVDALFFVSRGELGMRKICYYLWGDGKRVNVGGMFDHLIWPELRVRSLGSTDTQYGQ